MRDSARPGDFVYFDPPYFPLTGTASFTSYTADGFTVQDQVRLAAVFCELVGRGVYCMASNHDVPQVHRLYAGEGGAASQQQRWPARAKSCRSNYH